MEIGVFASRPYHPLKCFGISTSLASNEKRERFQPSGRGSFVMLCYVLLYYAILCYVMLCYVGWLFVKRLSQKAIRRPLVDPFLPPRLLTRHGNENRNKSFPYSILKRCCAIRLLCLPPCSVPLPLLAYFHGGT